jgi:hypothetical protein
MPRSLIPGERVNCEVTKRCGYTEGNAKLLKDDSLDQCLHD